jgi:hypothetical protein
VNYDKTREVLGAFDDLETERADFDGIEVTIVTPRMLYQMKKSTIRPQDRAEAEDHGMRDRD